LIFPNIYLTNETTPINTLQNHHQSLQLQVCVCLVFCYYYMSCQVMWDTIYLFIVIISEQREEKLCRRMNCDIMCFTSWAFSELANWFHYLRIFQKENTFHKKNS
jgi:hypothetical protein